MMASVRLWHLCADSLVECRTAILKIDELGRSMTHLWRDWELMRSSTVDWWVETVRLHFSVCVCVYRVHEKMQELNREHVSLQEANAFVVTLNHLPQLQPTGLYLKPWNKGASCGYLHHLCYCAYFTVCFLMLHHRFMQEYVGGSSWPTAVVYFHRNAYTCNLNMHYTTLLSVGNRRLNCLW